MTTHIDVTREGDALTARITQDSLQHFATSTLIGHLGNCLATGAIKTINLVFVESSLAWRQSHDGPEQWIMNEYVPQCLVADVLWLVEHGYRVTSRTEEADARASQPEGRKP